MGAGAAFIYQRMAFKELETLFLLHVNVLLMFYMLQSSIVYPFISVCNAKENFNR